MERTLISTFVQAWPLWAGLLVLLVIFGSMGAKAEPPPPAERNITNTHWAHLSTSQNASWLIPAILFGLAVGYFIAAGLH